MFTGNDRKWAFIGGAIGGFLFGGCVPDPPEPYTAEDSDLVLNEVMMETTDASEAEPFVELFNGGAHAVDLTGYQLANLEGDAVLDLPVSDLAAGDYLTITLPGDDGTLTLDVDHDGLGLLDPTGSPVDFLSWCHPDRTFEGGPTQDAAVSAGIWSDGTTFATVQGTDVVEQLVPGESIGRDSLSTDTNSPADWGFDGGPDAVKPSPAAVNANGFGVAPAPAPPPTPPVGPASWTVMVYANADDPTLEKYIFDDLNEIEQGLDGDDVKVVALLDGFTHIVQINLETGERYWNTQGGTWVAELQHDEDDEIIKLHTWPGAGVKHLYQGERQLGDGDILRQFATWAMGAYPAGNYALIIDSHGAGWKGVSADASERRKVPINDPWERDAIQIGELGAAVDGLGLDLIAFDASLMGMIEVADEVAGGADVMVASQAVRPATGFPYDWIMDDLCNNPAVSPQDLAQDIVANYAGFHTGEVWTLSAVDLNAPFGQLMDEVDEFASELGAVPETTRNPDEVGGLDDHGHEYSAQGSVEDNVQTAVGDALMACEHFGKMKGDANYIDLSDFANQLDLDGRLTDDLQEQAWDVVTAVNDAVLDYRSSDLHDDARGLSIYFPVAQTKTTSNHTKAWAVEESPYDAPMKPTEDGPDDAWVKYGPDPNPGTCTDDGRDGDAGHPLPNAPGFDFVDDTAWNEMLMRFYEPVADAQCFPRLFIGGGTTICQGEGSSDWDGEITDYYWDGDALFDSDDSDVDKDCRVEPDDDVDAHRTKDDVDKTVEFTFNVPGTYDVVLTVHDDHDAQDGHGSHFETDQDAEEIVVLPLFKYVPEMDWAFCPSQIGMPDMPIPFVIELTNTSNQTLTNVQIRDTFNTAELGYVCTPSALVSDGYSVADMLADPFMWAELVGLDPYWVDPIMVWDWMYCGFGSEDPLTRPELTQAEWGEPATATFPAVDLAPGQTVSVVTVFTAMGDHDGDGEMLNEVFVTADDVGEGQTSASVTLL